MGIFGRNNKKQNNKDKLKEPDRELTLEELDKVTAGMPVSGESISDLSTKVYYEPTEAELTEEELDQVTAGVPEIEDDRSI